MARNQATAIFDVHEDENRERRYQLVKKFLEKKRGKAAVWPTLKQMHELNALMHDPLKSDFRTRDSRKNEQ